jgi:hypothetical protein
MWWLNDMNIARKIKPYSILLVLFSPETALPFRISNISSVPSRYSSSS